LNAIMLLALLVLALLLRIVLPVPPAWQQEAAVATPSHLPFVPVGVARPIPMPKRQAQDKVA
jgi:hypothetical protein